MSETEYLEKYDSQKPHRNDTDIVFYGLSAVKSAAAVEIAHQLGFTGLVPLFSGEFCSFASMTDLYIHCVLKKFTLVNFVITQSNVDQF